MPTLVVPPSAAAKPTMTPLVTPGLDVSHYQGMVDWAKLAPSIGFAYIKATEGAAVTDRLFASNWAQAKAAGVARGAYHFWRPGAENDQTAVFTSAVPVNDAGELPPALDVEIGPMDRAEFVGMSDWLARITRFYGRVPVLYLSPATIRQFRVMAAGDGAEAEDLERFAEHYPLWLADYNPAIRPGQLAPWTRWTFWQHTAQGALPGIQGPVDLDTFNGPPALLAGLLTPPQAT